MIDGEKWDTQIIFSGELCGVWDRLTFEYAVELVATFQKAPGHRYLYKSLKLLVF